MAETTMQRRPVAQPYGLASRQMPPTVPSHASASRIAAPAADNHQQAAANRGLVGTFDHSPRVIALRQMGEVLNRSPRVASVRALTDGLNDSPGVAQRAPRRSTPNRMEPELGAAPPAASAQTQARSVAPRAGQGPARFEAWMEAMRALPRQGTLQAVGNAKYREHLKSLEGLKKEKTADDRSAHLAARSLHRWEEAQSTSSATEESQIELDIETEPRPHFNMDTEFGMEVEGMQHSFGETEVGMEVETGRKAPSSDRSIEYVHNRPVGAFIVNAILPYGDVEKIPQVLNAMLAGLMETNEGRVAVVLGINAPKAQQGSLTTALKRAQALVANLPYPVALVTSTFAGKKFPYGRMRNEVLHSKETQDLTRYFTSKNLHPYVSFQDFDTGSRRVGSEEGPHVFDAVEKILARGSHDDDLEDLADPIRPLMIAGGYRTGPQEGLVNAVRERLKKEKVKGVTAENLVERLEAFPQLIADDMRARDMYAGLDPLLPYAPEPNLFIDATAALRGSPLTNTRLEFGPKGAEATELEKRLARYAAEELESFYEAQAVTSINREDLIELGTSVDREELEAKLLVDAQNNRHPQRGKSFHTAFQGLAVATDLSRLAHGGLKGKKPQSHAGLTTVVDRGFESKKAKKGVSLAKIRDKYKKKDLKKALDPLYVREGGKQGKEAVSYFQDNKSALGGEAHQQLSLALQVPFTTTGSFSGLNFGVPSTHVPYFTHQIALQGPIEQYPIGTLSSLGSQPTLTPVVTSPRTKRTAPARKGSNKAKKVKVIQTSDP